MNKLICLLFLVSMVSFTACSPNQTGGSQAENQTMNGAGPYGTSQTTDGENDRSTEYSAPDATDSGARHDGERRAL
jgi:hypothetical protein